MCPLGHHVFAFVAFARVKWRRIDHHQHLGPGLLRQAGGLVKPSVFANQQPDFDRIAALPRREHAGAGAGREVTPLVKHLVVRQLAFGVGVNHHPALQYPRGVVALLHGNAFGAQAVARHYGRADHHDQVL